jgi:hypothetical protein
MYGSEGGILPSSWSEESRRSAELVETVARELPELVRALMQILLLQAAVRRFSACSTQLLPDNLRVPQINVLASRNRNNLKYPFEQ